MSTGRHRRRASRLRALRRPIILFACAFALASGTAAFAYTTASGRGSGQAQAVTLQSPGAGTASAPTATTLSLSWPASAGLPPHGGYLVLRSTSATGPYTKASSGSCQQDITLVSASTTCTDTGLAPGTTYYYEIESAYYDVSTLWVSAPDASFSGTTATATTPSSAAPDPAPAPSGTAAPVITSAASSTFQVGTAASFQVAASGSPAPAFSDAAFSGCTPTALPADITFSAKGLLSGKPAGAHVGSYTVCVDAANGVAPAATQKFTLTVADQTLVFSSAVVSGATSSTPNLGPVTVRRQTSAGVAITTGALTVSLSSSPSAGATFGATQFAGADISSVTIPAGQSTATFWYGSTTPGSPAVTAAAAGSVSGSQVETITAAPVGLGVTLSGNAGGGSPVLGCGPPGPNAVCKVSGVGAAGTVSLAVDFTNAAGSPVVYSASQPSTVKESGQSTGSVTIGPGAASSAAALTDGVGTSTLTFGPYTLVIDVSA